MNFIILGDKFQKRMKSKGSVGLIKINGKSIIEHQYKNIKSAHPNANIIYVYGFDKKKFLGFINKNNTLKNNLITIYNPNYEKLNNIYSLSLAEKYLDDKTFILFGDNCLNQNYFKRFNSESNTIFISNKIQNKLGCIINDSSIENISYDLTNYLTEVYYINDRDIGFVQNFVKDPAYHNYFIFEMMNKLIDCNKVVRPHFLDLKSVYIS